MFKMYMCFQFNSVQFPFAAVSDYLLVEAIKWTRPSKINLLITHETKRCYYFQHILSP